jgi:hypothetical protein
MIKNFSIFRNKPSDNEKAPTHSISAKIGEEYVNIGVCWTKEAKNGKFLSCKLQDVYVDHSDRTKCRKGFAIADEKSITFAEEMGIKKEDEIKSDDEDIEIPF